MYGMNYGRRGKTTIPPTVAKEAKHRVLAVSLMVLTVFLSSLIIPTNTAIIHWLVCLFSLASLVLLVKKTRTLILCVIFFLISITLAGSPVIPALIFGSAVSFGTGAALLRSSKGAKLILCLLLPVSSFAAAYLATGNIIAATTSLFIYVPISALWISSKTALKRTTSIALCGGVLTLIVFFFVGDLIYFLYGELNVQAVALAASDLSDTMVLLTDQAFKMIGQADATEALLNSVRAATDVLINLSVGIVGALCLVFAYFAQAIELQALEALGNSALATENEKRMTASVTSAVVFILAHLISFATDASANLSFAATVATNLYIMLTPLFIYMGIDTALTLPKKRVFAGILLFIAIISVAFLIPSSLMTVLALTGAFSAMITELDVWAKEHYRKGDNNE